MTYPNGAIYLTRRYVDQDHCVIPANLFRDVIVNPLSLDFPCATVAPGFGQIRMKLDLDELYTVVSKRHNKTARDTL